MKKEKTKKEYSVSVIIMETRTYFIKAETEKEAIENMKFYLDKSGIENSGYETEHCSYDVTGAETL